MRSRRLRLVDRAKFVDRVVEDGLPNGRRCLERRLMDNGRCISKLMIKPPDQMTLTVARRGRKNELGRGFPHAFGRLSELSNRKRCITRSTTGRLRLDTEPPHSFGSRTTADSNGFSALLDGKNELIRYRN